MYNKTKNDQFDSAPTPVWLKLQEVISGWSHIIPMFKTGTYTAGTGGNPTTYNNFGAGVMFLPSALAYYSNSTGSIPSYTPLIFTFKLIELRYRDQDYDGILSKDERVLDPSIDPLIRWKENPASSLDYHYDDAQAGVYDINYMDTDGDGVANMYDVDDDGDHVLTKVELLRYTDAISGKKYYYKYDGAVDDDLTTPFDERQGIPSRTGTEPNYIYDYLTSTRKRKHVDNTW